MPSTAHRRTLLHLAALVALTFAIRVAFYLPFRSHWDYPAEFEWDGWGRIASYMADGYGLSDTHLMTYFERGSTPFPTASRPPLPILLFAALFGLVGTDHLSAVLLLQATIDAATAVALYFIVQHLFRKGIFERAPLTDREIDRVALGAGFAYACFFPEWRYAIGFQSEPLSALLLTTALFLTLPPFRSLRLILAGCVFGLLALTRPVYLVAPALITPWLVFKNRHAWKQALLPPLLAAMVVAPWALRNYLIFGEPIATQTLLGYDLFRHSGAIAGEDYVRWVSLEEATANIEQVLHSHGTSLATITEPALDRLLKQEALGIIRTHPGRYFYLSLRRAIWLFYDPNIGTGIGRWLRLVYFGWLAPVLLAVAFTVWHYRGRWVVELTPVWLMFAYTVVMHSLIVAQFRYLLPIIPWMIVIAAYGVARDVGGRKTEGRFSR